MQSEDGELDGLVDFVDVDEGGGRVGRVDAVYEGGDGDVACEDVGEDEEEYEAEFSRGVHDEVEA